MREIRKSSQLKKDFKRIKNDQNRVNALFHIIEILEQGKTIPIEFNLHLLKGEFKGIMECHIETDFLLMWIDEDEDIVRLLRLGSHSELFGM